jgi:hypothetical protein
MDVGIEAVNAHEIDADARERFQLERRFRDRVVVEAGHGEIDVAARVWLRPGGERPEQDHARRTSRAQLRGRRGYELTEPFRTRPRLALRRGDAFDERVRTHGKSAA